jgi:hypothetical protein
MAAEPFIKIIKLILLENLLRLTKQRQLAKKEIKR